MCKKIAAFTAALVAVASVGVFCRPVPVYAVDNYVGTSVWQNWVSYWHSSLNVAVSDITGGAFDADDLLMVQALEYAYASAMYQQAAHTFTQNSEIVPAGNVACGWYYRANEPHVVCTFGYNLSGDWSELSSTSVVLASSDDFTISCDLTLDSGQTFHGVRSNDLYSGTWYEYHFNHATITGLTGSGIVASAPFSSYFNQIIVRSGQYSDSVAYLDNSQYTADQFIGRYSSYDYTYNDYAVVNYFGTLKDSSGQPISNVRQRFVRASVSNTFPEFVETLKQELYTNYPENIVDIIWTEPETPYDPIYPTGEYVTGLPKEWTVENPQLPSTPQMNIDVPDASFPDLSGLSQYTNGVGFWWSLTGWIMDTFRIREIVLLLIGLGVFAFLLYRLGAG